jgi:uncharacterized membrane protein (GlpM family)
VNLEGCLICQSVFGVLDQLCITELSKASHYFIEGLTWSTFSLLSQVLMV